MNSKVLVQMNPFVSRMIVLGALCAPGIAGAADNAAFPPSTFPPQTFSGLSGELLIYDTGGGPNSDARGATIFKRYTQLTGVPVRLDFSSDTSKFLAAMQTGSPPPWTIIEFGGESDFNQAKTAGYLEKLDPKNVPLDKLETGGADEFGIRAMNYGALMIWNTDTFPSSGPQPHSWADFYDVKKFPGKRCMFKFPQKAATLESALLADGQAADKLYPLDVERALKKLDTIKKDIVWWTSGAQSIQYMTNGECDLGITWTARVGAAKLDDHAPLGLSWNQAIYTSSYWGIPKGNKNVKAGEAALAMWILDRQAQIDYVSRFPQTTDIKGLSLSDYPENIRPFLPTGDNVAHAIRQDENYYEHNLPMLIERFNAWLTE